MAWNKVSENRRVKCNLLSNQSGREWNAGRHDLALRLNKAAMKHLTVAEAQEYAMGNNPWESEKTETQEEDD